ncbi:MAG TPA: hypothetical protein GX497_17935 [Bacillus bacterium]|nr:hypothetical protein [Bacillus sp. (in: firmicutes)]
MLLFLIKFSFLINPIFAIVFCINLISLIKKVAKDPNADIEKHAVRLTISATYIVLSLTALLNLILNRL